ncbi:major facilitator superfamily domain-containing protein [Cercophora newfieldiana]|uniref:Major facilitator superfamily domain-containing protein n=1 Tax=Cercophora newfieldiana TaxID=92897 RepID=A0AA39XW93_9PEZI|nr:major facilitator superfamily domain-containing protein [Cercophora newfieldiana]
MAVSTKTAAVAAASPAESDNEGPTKKGLRSYIWDTDSHLKSPAERRLLLKLDLAILIIGCFGFFMKFMDQWNLASAYISGMRKDLSMFGNEYTYATTAYTVGYAIMQIPSTLIVQKIHPAIWLGTMEVGWGIWTFAQAGLTNMPQLYAFRFLVGLFEASFSPVVLYVIGGWYTKTELAKRTTLFQITAPLGAAFSGYLQAAVYEGLDGRNGLAGWRWLYIICGLMTLPVGIATFFFFPDTPYKKKPWFLTEEEHAIAIRRVQSVGIAPPAKITLGTFKRILTRWRIYAFVLGYVLYGCSSLSGGFFGIWLMYEGFSVVDSNVISSGTWLISGFLSLTWGYLSDITKSRFTWVVIPLILGLLPNGILAVWPAGIAIKQFAFLTIGFQLMPGVFFAWAHEVCRDDNEERAIVASSMNGMSYVILAWLPILTFPQTMAPDFRYGFTSSFGLLIAAIFAVVLIQFLVKREERLKAAVAPEERLETAGEGGDSSKKDSGEDIEAKVAGLYTDYRDVIMASNNNFGPGRTVAVIGAGIAGVSAAAYLLKEGLSVTVFERSGIGGGIWHFDERIPTDPPYPNDKPSLGDYEVSQRGQFAGPATPPPEPESESHLNTDSKSDVDIELRFAPPGPCYAGLKTNIPTNVLVSSLGPWPEGTEQKISQELAEKYIQSLAIEHGVTAVTHLHTRVDEVKPASTSNPGAGWEVRTVTLEKHGLKERLWHFDLVVVATGHYCTPRIPDFPGLANWKSAFPDRIIHSKQYRRPERFRGQNVLVIGAGVSSSDICRELDGIATTVYQSVRGGMYDTPTHLMPASTIRVGPISSFSPLPLSSSSTTTPLPPNSPIPASITLTSGSTLHNIHAIILATGYITSYPFLAHLHSDSTPLDSASPEILITSDGDMVHNLHQHIFYIPDPTLAFIGVSYHAAAFTLFGFQAQVLARVFAGKASLPTREEMVAEYERLVEEKGRGRVFHSLAGPGAEVAYVKGLVGWVNEEGEKRGERKIEAHSEEWVREYEEFKARLTEEWFRKEGGEEKGGEVEG